MFEAVGVLAVSACILQMVYEKFDEQRTTVDYTEENKQFQQYHPALHRTGEGEA